MDNMTLAIIGGATVLVIGAVIVSYSYKKRNLNKLFEQAYENIQQVPKQKKNSFLLFLFTEALTSKKKSEANASKLNNPKYLEIQLLKMSKILKDGPDNQDKKTKHALQLLKSYQEWEDKKNATESQS